MKWLAISTPILAVCLVAPVLAEKPTVVVRPTPTPGATFSMGELTPTPDMWFFEQYMRQYQDPKTGVRNAAEFRAEQRMRRLAAAKWYGVSNARPHASVDSVHSDYSIGWTSGSANYPNRWGGASASPVIITNK